MNVRWSLCYDGGRMLSPGSFVKPHSPWGSKLWQRISSASGGDHFMMTRPDGTLQSAALIVAVPGWRGVTHGDGRFERSGPLAVMLLLPTLQFRWAWESTMTEAWDGSASAQGG